PYSYGGGDPVSVSDPDGLYSYQYFWTLGGRGSADHVFHYFGQHMRRVFPFNTGKCWRLYLNEHCEFHPTPGSNDFLHVEMIGSNWVTLDVDKWCQLGIGPWCLSGDPPGSTIQFSVRNYPAWYLKMRTRTGWDAVLIQKANAPKAGGLTNIF